jgi:hypothetical protein
MRLSLSRSLPGEFRVAFKGSRTVRICATPSTVLSDPIPLEVEDANQCYLGNVALTLQIAFRTLAKAKSTENG